MQQIKVVWSHRNMNLPDFLTTEFHKRELVFLTPAHVSNLKEGVFSSFQNQESAISFQETETAFFFLFLFLMTQRLTLPGRGTSFWFDCACNGAVVHKNTRTVRHSWRMSNQMPSKFCLGPLLCPQELKCHRTCITSFSHTSANKMKCDLWWRCKTYIAAKRKTVSSTVMLRALSRGRENP